MPGRLAANSPVALVTGDQLLALVRTSADDVHDMVRRCGCPPAGAATVVAASALDLVTVLRDEPETVGDMLGWWFGRAEALAARRCGPAGNEHPAAGPDTPDAPLRDTALEHRLVRALETLDEPARRALRLRDAYDLAPEAVAVALRVPVPEACERVAAARLQFLSAYDGRGRTDLSGHLGPPAPDLGLLGRVADTSVNGSRAAASRAHGSRCDACEDVLTRQARARAIVAGLSRTALPDADYGRLLTVVQERADGQLGRLEDTLLGNDGSWRPEPADRSLQPLLPPLLIAAAVALAVLLGVLTSLL